MSDKLRIFLCHGKEDTAIVRELYHQLNSDGFEAWLDEEDILPGQKWQIEIPKAVKTSDIVLVCLSNTSINKAGYVQREIKFALDIADNLPDSSIFIMPLLLEECAIPERLSKLATVDLFLPDGFEKLTKALQAIATRL
jgi:TIR domain